MVVGDGVKAEVRVRTGSETSNPGMAELVLVDSLRAAEPHLKSQ